MIKLVPFRLWYVRDYSVARRLEHRYDLCMAWCKAATLSLVTTVTTHRAGLAATSLTERTSPVIRDPSIVNVVFSFRYWAYRQRRAKV